MEDGHYFLKIFQIPPISWFGLGDTRRKEPRKIFSINEDEIVKDVRNGDSYIYMPV